MAKTGRNQPCTCGSGKKYKKCCGGAGPAEFSRLPASIVAGIEQMGREAEALRVRRLQQQGLGRPIISADVSGMRVVVVGKRIYHSSKWVTFHDFLRHYLLGSFGQQWVADEQSKQVEDRHQILRWYAQAIEYSKSLANPSGITSGPMTGAIQAFLNLAYNIYLIAHHGEGQAMADIYLRRLRSSRDDDFVGALFETYAAAAFLKAGFSLTYEELRKQATSCVEFVATWPRTGERFSVEVKTRHHTAHPDEAANQVDEIRRLRVGSKLASALAKNAAHTRVVMIEVNVPDILVGGATLEGWPVAALKQIRDNEKATQSDGSPLPPAYVFVTNHSFHHDLNGAGGNMQALAVGFRMPDFGPDVLYEGYAGVVAARERHAPMTALIASMKTHYEIPATFDGELPSSLEPASTGQRLVLGKHYAIPSTDEPDTVARLHDAKVDTTSGTVHLVFERGDGRHVMGVDELTADELAEYRRYPDTFFGAVSKPSGRVDTFVDLCDFLFDSYRNTPRDELLALMGKAADIERLRTLGQRDLAIAYSERMASAFRAQAAGGPADTDQPQAEAGNQP